MLTDKEQREFDKICSEGLYTPERYNRYVELYKKLLKEPGDYNHD